MLTLPPQHASADVERLLVGNKCDWEVKRAIPTERGRELAAAQGVSFLETSAKTNHNIDQVLCWVGGGRREGERRGS